MLCDPVVGSRIYFYLEVHDVVLVVAVATGLAVVTVVAGVFYAVSLGVIYSLV